MSRATKLPHGEQTAMADSVAALREEADGTALQLVDSAQAAPRPENIDGTYKEYEFDERANEQVPLHDAAGEQEARESTRAAAGLEPAKATAEALASDHLPAVGRARERFENTVAALGMFRIRGHHAKLWYGARTACLFAGDIAGISGAAISLGEIPLNAFLLAGSASVATIAAGMVGKDVRSVFLRQRRAAAARALTPAQEPYRHLFESTDEGLRLLRGVVSTSAAVGITIGLGIYGLRSAIEGSLSGLVFGALAVAVVAGSFLSSFAYGDDVSDQIDAARHDYEGELRRARRLARSRPWAAWKRQDANASSILAEHALRGQAAQLAVTGAKWRLLSRNPAVVGHGPARHTEQIGRRSRSHAESADGAR